MSRAPEVVVAIQSVIASWSVVASLYAARKGLHDWKFIHLAVALLSTVYLAGYLWLLILHPDRKTWSEVMVGVGFVTWPVAWIGPSVMSVRSNRPIKRLAEKVAEYDSADTLCEVHLDGK